MDEEYLIELVCTYPVLYDLSHAKYMDVRYKSEIWKRIGAELGQNASICKSRWNNIRDQYRKSLKKEAIRSGQSATKLRPYKYRELLGFLNVSYQEKGTPDSLGAAEVKQDSKEEFCGDDEYEKDPLSQHCYPKLFQPHNLLTPEQTLTTTPPKEILARRTKTPSYLDRKSLSHHSDETSSTLATRMMDYIVSKERSATAEPHPVDAFLASIAPVLKSLDPLNLNRARSEMFAVVQKYELAMLMSTSTETSPTRQAVLDSPSNYTIERLNNSSPTHTEEMPDIVKENMF
ncbi:uncharacterized protein LOC131689719 [Topomyia yanbarensis]|uniref:uncharacterized protein LOC131689719 n=1 Tax=Topomyia yanbarensis TaxID=2498891 RepID=UPI00273B75BD|nr:uncharacterized protein LOC131689719 [Topomyia yanbarensis]